MSVCKEVLAAAGQRISATWGGPRWAARKTISITKGHFSNQLHVQGQFFHNFLE
jgi:hypothetical protein